MATIAKFVLPVFLILAGLKMCGVILPRWLAIIGGVCGIVAGVLMLF